VIHVPLCLAPIQDTLAMYHIGDVTRLFLVRSNLHHFPLFFFLTEMSSFFNKKTGETKLRITIEKAWNLAVA
jgi:hypothetical protein